MTDDYITNSHYLTLYTSLSKRLENVLFELGSEGLTLSLYYEVQTDTFLYHGITNLGIVDLITQIT